MAKRFNEVEKLLPALNAMANPPPEGRKETHTEKTARALKDKADVRFKHFATTLESSEERIELYFREPLVVAQLLREALLVPAEMIGHLYGSPTRITATLLGLRTTGETTELNLKAGTNMAQSTAYMANEYSRLVAKNFRYGDDVEHVVPIAVYFEADTVAVNP